MRTIGSRSRRSLWRLAVTTLPEAEEAVVELVGRVAGLPACSIRNFGTGETIVSVWFDQKLAGLGTLRIRLRAELARMKDYGIDAGSAKIAVSKVPVEDWAQSWKRHFPPMEIGRALLIRPSWSRRRARKGQRVVVLDPGLSFGTGRHPTTAFCLRELVARRERDRGQSFLDLGCGSGILAIAAAKLGYFPIEAIDLDPEAVHVACANARRNGVFDRIKFREQDLAKLPRRPARKHDVICANLISSLLAEERGRILSHLAADGTLVVAGILKEEFPAIQCIFEAGGLKLRASRTEGEWHSGAFVWMR